MHKSYGILYSWKENNENQESQSQRVEAARVKKLQIIFRSRPAVIQNFLGKVGESDGIRTVYFTDSPQRLVCSYTLRK